MDSRDQTLAENGWYIGFGTRTEKRKPREKGTKGGESENRGSRREEIKSVFISRPPSVRLAAIFQLFFIKTQCHNHLIPYALSPHLYFIRREDKLKSPSYAKEGKSLGDSCFVNVCKRVYVCASDGTRVFSKSRDERL